MARCIEMKSRNPYQKRRQVFADRAIQLSLAWRLVGHWLLFTSVLVVLNTFLFAGSNIPQKSIGEAFYLAAWAQLPLIICVLALAPLFVRDALRISNRLAGPMVRLRSSLRTLASGETCPPLVFRENDYWLESATEFNRVRQLVMGLAKEKPQITGASSSQSNANIASELHDEQFVQSDANTTTSVVTNAVESAVNESTTPHSSLSLANRVIWQGERNNKPSRYVHQEVEPATPIIPVTDMAEIPVAVSPK